MSVGELDRGVPRIARGLRSVLHAGRSVGEPVPMLVDVEPHAHTDAGRGLAAADVRGLMLDFSADLQSPRDLPGQCPGNEVEVPRVAAAVVDPAAAAERRPALPILL